VIARLHGPSGEYDLTLGLRHRRRLTDETGFADPSLAKDYRGSTAAARQAATQF
jgi:hypothetical protein